MYIPYLTCQSLHLLLRKIHLRIGNCGMQNLAIEYHRHVVLVCGFPKSSPVSVIDGSSKELWAMKKNASDSS